MNNIRDFDKVSAIKGDFSKNAMPTNTLVETNRMTSQGAHIEIEVTAIVEKN